MKNQINKLVLFVFFTTLLISIASFYFPNRSFGFDIGGALKSLGESITDTGDNQNCREVMDDYGDFETICEPNENQQSEGIRDNAKEPNQGNITEELKTLIEQGKKFSYSGRFIEAIEKWKEAVRFKPDYALAHHGLGSTYIAVKRYDEGIASLKQAIRLKPDLAKSYNNLGIAYNNLERYDHAISSLNEAVRLKPDLAHAHLSLGYTYDKLGKGSLAIKHTKKAKELFKSQGDIENVSNAGQNLRAYYDKYEGKNQPQPVIDKPTGATGTGFLLGSSNYIITNYHVVKGFNSLQVNFLSGEKSKAKIRANDKANDVAVLELLNPPDLVTNSMVVGDSSSVEMGEKVFTIGYPVSGILGKNPKYAEGVISSTTGISDDPRMFQITVPIQPGNSGGPLFNNKGEVIGITTSSLDAMKAFKIMGAIPQNVNFAIKSSYIKGLLQSIPDSMVSLRSIVVVPSDPESRVSGLIKQVKNNIVLVESSSDNSLPAFVELDDAKSNPVVETKRKVDLKEKVRLAKKRQTEIEDRFKTLKEMESLDDSLISIEEKQEAIKNFIKDYPDRNPRLEEAQQMLELIVQ
jgi:S1-C subfamily serine protease